MSEVMRWICAECHHPTDGSWCELCRRNTGIKTAADLGPPRDPRPATGISPEKADWVVGKIVGAYGGRDPKKNDA